MSPDEGKALELMQEAVSLLRGNLRPVDSDSWLSTSELAERVHKHPSTLRRWIKEHGLPAKQLPGTGGYLIRYGDFMAWREDGDVEQVMGDVILSLDRRMS